MDLQVWDGLPTYPAESQPDTYFRLRYDAARWALTADQFGYTVLASRGLPGCVIAPSSGRGLPPVGSADHEVRLLGDVTYQISRVAIGDRLQFLSYAGGDSRMYTGFEVRFQDQVESCAQESEIVLSTLRSVPASEATPAVK